MAVEKIHFYCKTAKSISLSVIVPSITEDDKPPIFVTYLCCILNGSKSLTAQSPLFVIFPFNFITLHNLHKMLSKYQITEKHIPDTINVFHNGDYTNSTAMAQALGVDTKTVH